MYHKRLALKYHRNFNYNRKYIHTINNKHKYKNINILSNKRDIIYNTVKWYGWSVIYNIYNKETLITLPNPYFVTSMQSISSSIGCIYVLSKNKTNLVSLFKSNPRFLYVCIGLSISQFLGNYYGNLATLEMSYAMVNIVKSSEPILTMIMMYIIYQTKIQNIKYLSILLIITGIIICIKSHDMNYSHLGILLCILSNLSHIIKTIISKQYFSDIHNIKGYELFSISMIGSTVLGIPSLINQMDEFSNLDTIIHLPLLISCISYYLNSIAAFDVIATVNPVTFSVLNIYKRVIIILSYFVIHYKLPSLNILIGLIISNIGLFNYIK